MAIAALLHDAVEDAVVQIARIEQEFGTRVSDVVMECTDGTPDTKRDASTWRARKSAYNARTILLDLRAEKARVWERFNVSDPQQQLWYYGELAKVFDKRLSEPRWLPEELTRTVLQIGLIEKELPEEEDPLGAMFDAATAHPNEEERQERELLPGAFEAEED